MLVGVCSGMAAPVVCYEFTSYHCRGKMSDKNTVIKSVEEPKMLVAIYTRLRHKMTTIVARGAHTLTIMPKFT